MDKEQQKATNENAQKIEVSFNTKIDLRIRTDGSVTEIEPKDKEEGYRLQEMYEMCNADIVEFIYLPEEKIMVVDEHGALKRDKKINGEATRLVASLVLKQGGDPFFIFGDVMLVNDNNIK